MSFLNVAAVICVLAVARMPKSFGLSFNDCRRPDGSTGDCVEIHECDPVIKLLQSFTNRAPPSYVYDDLRKLRCAGSIGSIHVCCPKKPDELLPLDSCGKIYDYDKISFANKTQLFEYPWMAQLAYKTDKGIEYLCGGTLISDRYVLTAGHCVPRNSYRKLIYVRLGEHDMSSPIDCDFSPYGDKSCAPRPQDIEIESKIVHSEFKVVELLNDIALLRLKIKADTTEDSVKPICLPVLPNVRHAQLHKVVITGWGLTEENKHSNVLLQGSVGITDLQRCKELYKTINVTEAHFCIGDNTKVATCKGDSGGPIQAIQDFNNNARYVQYGVVSHGPGTCGADGQPGIHTRIEFYLDWILSNIRQ